MGDSSLLKKHAPAPIPVDVGSFLKASTTAEGYAVKRPKSDYGSVQEGAGYNQQTPKFSYQPIKPFNYAGLKQAYR